MTAPRRLWLVFLPTVVMVALAVNAWQRPEPTSVDFHTYVAAAKVGLQYGWSHVYDQGLVAAAEKQLVWNQNAQPFLSPPADAWIASPLAWLPYGLASVIWAALTLAVLVLALWWTSSYRGFARALAVAVAVAPWWVFHAVHVGQVVPLVAAGAIIAWRFLREDREVAAGLALSLILLKPNTAVVVPLAVLVAGRYRTFGVSVVAAVIVAGVSLLTLGTHGVSAYLTSLSHLPSGADSLTIGGALGLTGVAATALRILIVIVALVSAYRLRASPGMVIAVGVLASLIIAPYLHGSDLCLLTVAGWMVWEERPSPTWRVPLAGTWLLATPYPVWVGLGPGLTFWPLVEMAWLIVLGAEAWLGGRVRLAAPSLTGEADLGTQAPA